MAPVRVLFLINTDSFRNVTTHELGDLHDGRLEVGLRLDLERHLHVVVIVFVVGIILRTIQLALHRSDNDVGLLTLMPRLM